MRRVILIGMMASMIALLPNWISSYSTHIEQIEFHEYKIKETAFNMGERIVLRVHYGWFTAGEATFEIDNRTKTIANRNCYLLKGFGKSASTFDWFYTVRDTFYSYMDKETLYPVKYYRAVHEGGYNFVDEVDFSKENKIISKKGEFKVQGKTHDMLTSLYATRCLNLGELPTGKLIQVKIWLDNELYELGFKVLGKEIIKTDLGKFRAIKIQPLVVADRIFKDTDGMKLWVTDDLNHVPLRIESPILVGSIKADIKEMSFLKYPLTSKIH
jgi:hypothetical protein